MISVLLLIFSFVSSGQAFSSGAPCVDHVYLTQTPEHGVEVDNDGLYKLRVEQLNLEQYRVRITARNNMAGLILLAAEPDLSFARGERTATGSFQFGNDAVMNKYCLRYIQDGCIRKRQAIITHRYASTCPFRSHEHQCSRFNKCDIELVWTKPAYVNPNGLRFYLTAVPNRSIFFRAKSVVFLNEQSRSDDIDHQEDSSQDDLTTTTAYPYKTYPTYRKTG